MQLEYSCIRAADLTAAQAERWDGWLAGCPELDTPFLHVDFMRAVAEVRDDVHVGLLQSAGELRGCFAFQRRGTSAEPVCGRLSEYHGAVVPGGIDWSPTELFRACGLRAWHFDHLAASQTVFARFAWGWTDSPTIDLRAGYAAYRNELRRRGESFAQVERKARKLEREVGPLEFQYDTPEPDVLARLIDWKTEQYRRTGMLQIFARDWTVQLLRRLLGRRTAGFSAPLATLTAGGRLVAAHLGLASRTGLHVWFPAYDSGFDKYSPGLILLIRLVEAAADRGLQRIDLGPSPQRYKQNFKNADTPVAEGMISRDPVTARLRACWYHTKRRIRASAWRQQLEWPLRATRRVRQWLAFR
jgi:CelD/BcsL family acetyltransferase involved in cellulose biosynthesis